MSGDPEQEYFADGMVEEIITALSRIRWLFVIARNSSFTYKGQSVGLQQVGRELGVRYLLEGSVRKAGSRVRINAQLIEAETTAHLWADRFDGSHQDVFDLQDQVAVSVAGVVEPALQASEIRRAARRPTNDLTAYDLCLRAQPLFWSLGKERCSGRLVKRELLKRFRCSKRLSRATLSTVRHSAGQPFVARISRRMDGAKARSSTAAAVSTTRAARSSPLERTLQRWPMPDLC
jgi:TolB-like protein